MNPNELADIIHKGVYKKPADPTAPENQNDYFKAGYKVGQECNDNTDTFTIIATEWNRIGSPSFLPYSFLEWKRGLWAAVTLRVITKAAGKPEILNRMGIVLNEQETSK
jgi:hypothetical protein